MIVATTWTSLRKPSGKRRPQRAVGEPTGEDGGLARATLTTEDAAGDLARRRTCAPRRRR